MTEHMWPASASRRSRRPRATIAGLTLALAGAIGCWCSSGIAVAAVTTFAMSPTSGPPGTVVHVSGTGCTPGLLASSNTDFVTVTAATLGLAIQAPAAADGSWQGTFAVRSAGSAGGPATVAALCVSDGLQALTTVYAPRTFTVTANATTAPPGGTSSPTTVPATAPTTAPPAIDAHEPSGGTNPVTTPTHRAPPASIAAPGSPTPTTRSVSAGARGATEGPRNPLGIVGVLNGRTRAVAALARKHTAASKSATLPSADLGISLASDPGSGSGGLAWLGWFLLVVLLTGALGTPAWLWFSRRSAPAESGGEAL